MTVRQEGQMTVRQEGQVTILTCLAGRTCGSWAAKQAVWQEGQVTGRKDN